MEPGGCKTAIAVGCEIDMKNKCSTNTIFAVFILLIKLVFSLFVLKSLILILNVRMIHDIISTVMLLH